MEYSNSPLAKRISWSRYYSSPREYPITRITPHMYWGQVDLNDMCGFFADPDRVVSPNYGISRDGDVCMAVEEKNRSWCTNHIENDGRAVTIEVASDQAPPYAVRPEAFETLVALCADICLRNGKRKLIWIPDKAKALSYALASDEMLLTVHMWFFDTPCPGAYLMARMGELAERVTALLNDVPDNSDGDMPPADDPAPEPDESPEIVSPPAEPPAAEQEQPPCGFATRPTPAPEDEDSMGQRSAGHAGNRGLQAADLQALTGAEIVEKLGPLFTEEQRRTGIMASLNFGQWILESGCGRSDVFRYTNNGFGLKAWVSGNRWPNSVWDGQKYTTSTPEYGQDGTLYTITDSFRVYPNIEASIADHSAYLLGATDDDEVREHLRYAGIAGCTDYKQAAKILLDGGYATDPEYADHLIHVIESWDLARFDLSSAESSVQEATGVEIAITTRAQLEALRQWLVNALDVVENMLNE